MVAYEKVRIPKSDWGSKDFHRLERLAKAFPNEPFLKAQSDHGKKYFKMYEKDKDSIASKHFPYIQLDHRQFLTNIMPFIKRNSRFCDMGCGAGDKLALVHNLRPSVIVHGVEYDKEMADTAQNLCPFATIYNARGESHYYANYDVVYSYTPAKDIGVWFRMIQQVMLTLKPGAIFLCKDVLHMGILPWNEQITKKLEYSFYAWVAPQDQGKPRFSL